MNTFNKVVLLTAALALGACTNPGRFGADNATDLNAANAGTAAGIVPGSANDPTSSAYFQQTIGDRVLFVVDQSTLTPEGITTLNGQAGWLTSNPDYIAVIEGHADEQGTREYNLALGARRANAVREYLISQGIAAGRLKVISYGKERPIEVCSDEACYAKNRRAVTVLSGGLTG